jgi:hypothetical protein
MKRKCLAVGIILLFVGLAITPKIIGTSSRIRNQEIVDYENSTLQVIITRPENGIYFNEEKILPFCVPLILCGNITIWIEVIANGSGLDRVEFYINDLLQATIPGSGPVYSWCLSWRPFSKLNFKVIAYSFDESASDEIVIWRLFS